MNIIKENTTITSLYKGMQRLNMYLFIRCINGTSYSNWMKHRGACCIENYPCHSNKYGNQMILFRVHRSLEHRIMVLMVLMLVLGGSKCGFPLRLSNRNINMVRLHGLWALVCGLLSNPFQDYLWVGCFEPPGRSWLVFQFTPLGAVAIVDDRRDHACNGFYPYHDGFFVKGCGVLMAF
ncbi:hypothetical protein BCR42DRAFT_398225 [Absidia repens]|uniref:Uncharacterized protein n=1 Tax=Absidia repens TaxID=90262 RepID=A0A1X2HYU0_9FUNG|nr:hypothetical protein BCR42DRAFT_398225 [Absidia repens]